jgi:hypothetical protein
MFFLKTFFYEIIPMYNFFACLVCASAMLMTMTGCSEKKPDGLPLLQKVTLVVQQDGKPLAGASVSLAPEDKSITWSVGGVSNDKGEVTVRTHGQYQGAPLGKYTVIVTKLENTPSSLPEQAPLDAAAYTEWQRQRDAEVLPVYDLVEPQVGKANTSLLKIEITKATKTETLDCGKAIRQERK